MAIFRAIAAGFQAKAVDASSLTWQRLIGVDPAKSGVSVNTNTALKVSTVMACARVLANGIAQVPLKVYREDNKGVKTLYKEHPVYNLLWRRPNEWCAHVPIAGWLAPGWWWPSMNRAAVE